MSLDPVTKQIQKSLNTTGQRFTEATGIWLNNEGALLRYLRDGTSPTEHRATLSAQTVLLILANRESATRQAHIQGLIQILDHSAREIVSSYLAGDSIHARMHLAFSPDLARALVIEGGKPELRSEHADNFFREVRPALLSLPRYTAEDAMRAHPVALSLLTTGEIAPLRELFDLLADREERRIDNNEARELGLRIGYALQGVSSLDSLQRHEVDRSLSLMLISGRAGTRYTETVCDSLGDSFRHSFVDTLESLLNKGKKFPRWNESPHTGALRRELTKSLAVLPPERAPKLRAFLLGDLADRLKRRYEDVFSSTARDNERDLPPVALLVSTSPIPPKLFTVADDFLHDAQEIFERSPARPFHRKAFGPFADAGEFCYQILRIVNPQKSRPYWLPEPSGAWALTLDKVSHTSGALYRSLREIDRGCLSTFSIEDRDIIDTFERSSQHGISVDEADRAQARAVRGPLAYRLGIGLEEPLFQMNLRDFFADLLDSEAANKRAAADYLRMERLLPDTAKHYSLSKLKLPPYTRYLLRLMSAHRGEQEAGTAQ